MIKNITVKTLIKNLTTPESLMANLVDTIIPKGVYKKTTEPGQWIHYSMGNNRYTIVAHLDTRNEDNPPTRAEIQLTETKTIFGTTETIIGLLPNNKRIDCLGGDDRAGVTVIELLFKALVNNKVPKKLWPNVIFTYGEEVGLVGATNFVNHKINKNFKAPFMLQLDRRNDDIVFYNCNNTEFQKLLCDTLDKPKAIGSSSDIRMFQEKFKINSANVSVGFKNEHMTTETISAAIVQKTVLSLYNLVLNKDVRKKLGAFKWIKPKPITQYKPRIRSNITYENKIETPKKPEYLVPLKALQTYIDEANMYLDISETDGKYKMYISEPQTHPTKKLIISFEFDRNDKLNPHGTVVITIGGIPVTSLLLSDKQKRIYNIAKYSFTKNVNLFKEAK